MKVFTVLLLAGYVAGHGDSSSYSSDYKMYKRWTTMKAYEGCWGEENMRVYEVAMKQAQAKCSHQDAPELSLPPFRSTYRFINTLLTSADNMEKAQANFVLQKLMAYSNHAEGSNYHSHGNNYHNHPSNYNNNNNNNNNNINNLENNNFLQKMINSFTQQNNQAYSSGSSGNRYKSAADKELEEKIRESMMEFKMMQLGQQSRSINPFSGQNNYREKIQALLSRNRREAGIMTLPDTLDIGDRLAEKMREQQEKMAAEVGNTTCFLREVGIINQENELDINIMKKKYDQYSFPDEWFKARIYKDLETCVKVAQSLPAEVQDEQNYPGQANMAQMKSFMRCQKYAEGKSCMYKDVKAKVETNFGPLDQILEQTQLTENQLFPLIINLLHGDHDMDF